MNVKRSSSNYYCFEFKAKTVNQNFNFFVTADWHFDNPKTKRDLLFSHLDKCLEIGAYICIHGDLFCLMNGKYDPRRSKSAIMPEHMGDNYLDLVINDTAEKLKKYAKNILLITHGNHETAVSSKNETNVLERFVERLNTISGANVQVGGYEGFYTLDFFYGNDHKKVTCAYDHGHWGGIMTKGSLSVMRNAARFPQADVVFSGHTHDGFIIPNPRLHFSHKLRKVEVKSQWHVRTGTYKEEFDKGMGWAVEKIGMPKYLGGCFMEINYNKHKGIQKQFRLTDH